MSRILSSRWTKVIAFLSCSLPAAGLSLRAWQQDLGANPVEFIIHATGDWALRFLLITLAVTPMRKVLNLPALARFRRMLGLFGFFYGCLHFLAYLWLDKALDVHEILGDIEKRPFITIGLTSLLLMVPLAASSTAGWIRRLGARRWQWLHRLVYFSGLAAVVHYYWLVKSDIRLPMLYGAILTVLLAVRLVRKRSNPAEAAQHLKLASIKRETRDTVTLRFPVSESVPLRAKPGQFLTFDWVVDGQKLPRSYSISSSPLDAGYIEVTVKEQGKVSSFLNHNAKEGLTVQAHGPFGQFYFDEKRHRRVAFFAGGSGITPIMSMLRYITVAAPDTEVTLFYAVRTERDVIFERDLEDLKNHLPRFRCIMIASRPGWEWTGARGHVDRALIEQHLSRFEDQTFLLCGPTKFMATVKRALMSLDVHTAQILQERFEVAISASMASSGTVEFVKSGKILDYSSADTLLVMAERFGIGVPSSCRVGQCGTCATRVLEGEVEMEVEEGLDPALRAQGYRLVCVGHPRGNVKLAA